MKLVNGVAVDTDGDAIPDLDDTDSDNDGILDKYEGASDVDGDGTHARRAQAIRPKPFRRIRTRTASTTFSTRTQTATGCETRWRTSTATACVSGRTGFRSLVRQTGSIRTVTVTVSRT